MCWLALAVQAQEMHIQQYEKLKKGLFNSKQVVVDKKQAILDLQTSKSGFTFLANGKTEIAAEEGEGVLTLKMPDKTTYIVIKHDTYGQLTWKAPAKKGLRKKKHYTAVLYTFDPDEEFKLQKQWVVFDIKPSDAILTIDSTMTIVHNGKHQSYLPIGKHAYLAESPFYSEVKDSFELNDEKELNLSIELQPIYSYISVNTPMEGCRIEIDGQHIGDTRGTSGRLSEGEHHLVITKDGQKYYDAMVSIGWQQKKTIELTADDLKPIATPRISKTIARTGRTDRADKAGTPYTTDEPSVSFSDAFAIEQAADSIASKPIRDASYYGMISVHSNEIGAQVYVDGRLSGTTPCIVKKLPAGKCRVRLVKTGFHDAEKVVMVESNDLADVKLELKKKKSS